MNERVIMDRTLVKIKHFSISVCYFVLIDLEYGVPTNAVMLLGSQVLWQLIQAILPKFTRTIY